MGLPHSDDFFQQASARAFLWVIEKSSRGMNNLFRETPFSQEHKNITHSSVIIASKENRGKSLS